jgi:membrane associated rhomboid family serine protease
MSAAAAEVYRSTRHADCDERAFVLAALGIRSSVSHDGVQFVLLVEEVEAARALTQLQQYEQERRAAPAPEPAPPAVHAHAWIGCAIYALTLVGIGLLISNGFGRLDAFDTGELDAARVQSGQWWRAWTALTLHLDGAHLAANVAAGIWFGYLAARQIGSGNAWLLIVSGAALANLFEALLGPAEHRAVGASTLVFTALGMLAAHSWRVRYSPSQRWARQWAPLVGGVVLLGWFGSGGDDGAAPVRVDVVAHVLGFAAGVLLGALAAQPWGRRALARLPQWLGGLAALASIAIAWACALAS